MFGFDDIVGEGLKIINKFVPDSAQAAKLEAALHSEFMKFEEKFIEAKRDVIVAELNSKSWIARNWRALMMLMLVFIIFNNFVLVPYAAALGFPVVELAIPPDMWQLLQIGVGGYLAKQTAEGVANNVAKAKYGGK